MLGPPMHTRVCGFSFCCLDCGKDVVMTFTTMETVVQCLLSHKQCKRDKKV